MPWFVMFCFCTAPFLTGIGVTLAVPSFNNPGHTHVVYVSALIWIGLAYKLFTSFVDNEVPSLQTKWFLLAVVAPLVGCFMVLLWNDPEIGQLVSNHFDENTKTRPLHMAPTAPGAHLSNSNQIRVLIASVQPKLARFCVQLLTGLPPVWWILSFCFALWKGK